MEAIGHFPNFQIQSLLSHIGKHVAAQIELLQEKPLEHNRENEANYKNKTGKKVVLIETKRFLSVVSIGKPDILLSEITYTMHS